jgi:hypothetical protein
VRLWPLGPYVRANAAWRCECMDCGAKVAPTLNNVVRGKVKGCEHCGRDRANAAKFAAATKEALADLDEAGWVPLEAYRGANRPWRSRHRACGTISTPTISNIRRGHGCRTCAARRATEKSQRREAERAVADMQAHGFEPLTDYPGRSTEPWFSCCLTCGKESAPRLGNVRRGSGCRHCAGNVATTVEEAVATFETRYLKPLVPFPGTHRPWRSRCQRCGNIVSPKLTHVRHGLSKGCRYCSGLGPTDPDVAAANMRAAGAEPCGPFPGCNLPWPCTCLTCGNAITPRYSNVRRRCRACRFCAGGPDPTAPAMVYVVIHHGLGAVKVGVTSLEARTDRIDSHRRRGWDVVNTVKTPTGDIAYRIEDEVITYLENDLSLESYLDSADMPQGGATETFALEAVSGSEMWELVERFGAAYGGETVQGRHLPAARARRARKFSAEHAAEVMIAAGLEPLEDFPGSSKPWKCRCTRCNAVVYPRHNSVDQRGGGGCKPCGDAQRGLAQRVPAAVAETTLRAAGRVPLEPYSGFTSRPWKSKCDQCDTVSSPTLSRVKSKGRCCRRCSFANRR